MSDLTAATPQPQNIPDEIMRKHQLGLQTKDPRYEIDFVAWVDQIFNRIDKEDLEPNTRRQRKMKKNRHFYRGEQHMIWRNQSRSFMVYDVDTVRPAKARKYLVNNQVRPQCGDLLKHFVNSEPRLTTSSEGDLWENELAARMALLLLNHYEDTLVKEAFRQREARHIVLSGNAFWKTEYVEKQSTILNQTYDDLEGGIDEDSYNCSACGSGGPMSDLGERPEPDEIDQLLAPEQIPGVQCPACGKGPLIAQQAGSLTGMVQGDDEEAEIGDIAITLIDPIEVKVHSRARSIEQSPYFLRTQLVMEELLQSRYKFADIRQGSGWSLQSQMLRELETADGAKGTTYASTFYASAGGRQDHLAELRELYLDPPMYEKLRLREKLTVNGTDYPAGTRLIEHFPKGMYLAKAGELLCDLDGRCKNDELVHVCYDISADSFWGDSAVDDMIQIQIWMNECYSLVLDNIAHNAVTTTIVNQHQIDPANLTGDPKYVAELAENADPDRPIAEAVHQLKGTPLTQEVYAMIATQKGDMREMSKARLEMSGIVDQSNKTATGMAIMQKAQIEALSPPLRLRAEGVIDRGYQILILCQDHWIDERYDSLAGKYGEDMVTAFRNCNIRRDIKVSYTKGSEMPRTREDLIADTIAYLAIVAPPGVPSAAIPRTIRNWAFETYQPDIDLDELFPDVMEAQRRIQNLLQAIQGLKATGTDVSQPPAPSVVDGQEVESPAQQQFAQDIAALDASVPVLVYQDDHQTFVQEYRAWLKTDRGRKAPQVAKDILVEKMKLHFQAEQEFQAEQAMMAAPATMVADGAASEIGAQQSAAANPQQGPDPQAQAQVENQQADAQAHRDITTHAAKSAIDLLKYHGEKKIDKKYPPPKTTAKPVAKKK